MSAAVPPLVAQADAMRLPLRDCTVDLVVTSPPYFGLRSYEDDGKVYPDQVGAEATPQEYVDALLRATLECMRVLKPTGSLWVNLGDKYARKGGVDRKPRGAAGDPGGRAAPRPVQRGVAGVPDKSLVGLPWRYALSCIDDLGLVLRQEVVWEKPNAMPESVTDRCRRAHEVWLHLTMHGRYFSDLDAVREDYAGPPRRAGGGGTYRTMRAPGEKDTNLAEAGQHPGGRIPGTVWRIPTVPLRGIPAELDVRHFAAFPPTLPQRIISGWCPPGGVVLDPFGGTGTTAMVARQLGRTGISLDLSRDYCRVAAWRVNA